MEPQYDQQEAPATGAPSNKQNTEIHVIESNLNSDHVNGMTSTNHIPQTVHMSQPGGAGTSRNQVYQTQPEAYNDQYSVQNEPVYQSQPEDFYLMDVVGGGCVSQANLPTASKSVAVMHPFKPVVAYSAGCMIIVYDLMSDQKINLVGHQHDVNAIAFTPSGESILSIDFNRNAELQDTNGIQQEATSVIQLWDWQRGLSIQESQIPRSQNIQMMLNTTNSTNEGLISNTASCHIQVSFDRSGSLFMVLESSGLSIGGGYRVTLWSLQKSNQIEMISSMDLELQNPCIDVSFMPRTQSDIFAAQRSAGTNTHSAQTFLNQRIPFLTLEKNCLKIWEYSQGNAQLKKRIHIKQNIVSYQTSDVTGFYLILGENGKLLILDSQGEFVSTIHKEGVFFTQVGTAHDKLLLGTNRGTVHVFHIASLQFIIEIPYQLSFLQKFSLNIDQAAIQRDENLSLDKIGPPVTNIQLTQNLRFLWIQYSDGSFALVDRTISNPRQAILGYSCGHFESISGLQWMHQRSLNFGQHDGSQGENQYTADQQFVSCGHDLSVHFWKHYGDRWAFSYIDVAKCFDQCLSFQRKQCDRSTAEMKLTALCLYPRSNNLVVADSKRYVRVFQLLNNTAHLISTHKLQRPQDLNTTETSEISIKNDENESETVKSIYITSNENIAVITFSSGLISFFDIKNSYSFVGDVENSTYSKFNTMSSLATATIQTKVIEVKRPYNSSFSRTNSFFGQDEQPISFPEAQRSQYAEQSNLYGSYTSNLKVLSLTTPNQVSMQLIDIKGSKMTKTNLCQYVISEGKVTGFEVHPSNDYLLITSSKGRIYVFRIDTGELRGTIKIPLNANGCEVDPAGLYVIVKVPAFANSNAVNLVDGLSTSTMTHFGANEKELTRNTVLMYEIGTGQPAAEINSVFQITEMKFSLDGRFLTLGSSCGAISVWAMGIHLHQNIKQVLEAMKLQTDFWFNYPIFLPDYETFPQVNNFLDTQIQTPEEIKSSKGGFNDNQIRPPQRRSASNINQQAFQSNQIPQTYSQNVITPHSQLQRTFQFGKNTDNTRSNEFTQSHGQFYPSNVQPVFYPQAQQTFAQTQQSFTRPAWQDSTQPAMVQQPINNERRFLRSQKQTHQMMNPVTHGQYEIQQSQQQSQVLNQSYAINSQRQTNQGLYNQNDRYRQNYAPQVGIQSNQILTPPMQQPQPQWVRTPSNFGQYQPGVPQYPQMTQGPHQLSNSQYMTINDGLHTNGSTDRNIGMQQAFNQGSNDRIVGGEQQIGTQSVSQFYGPPQPQQFQQYNALQPHQQAFPPYYGENTQVSQMSMIPYYPPTQMSQYKSGLQGQQEQAAATLLGYGQAYTNQQHAMTLGQNLAEPTPVNQSSFLYNQPINATVNRQEPQATTTNFIHYKDLTGSNQKEAQQQPSSALPQFGYSQAQNQLQTYNQAQAADYQTPSKTFQQFEGTVNKFDRSLNDRETLGNTQLQEGLAQQNTVQSGAYQMQNLKETVQKVNADEFKPMGFTNTMTNDAILRKTLQKDPSDIDGRSASNVSAAGTKIDESGNLVNELDGMNKYMQNVRVPTKFNDTGINSQSFTLKNFRKDEKANLKNLYSGGQGVSAIPSYGAHHDPVQLVNRDFYRKVDQLSQGSSTNVKQSNHEVIDEMYANIDDFETKLKI